MYFLSWYFNISFLTYAGKTVVYLELELIFNLFTTLPVFNTADDAVQKEIIYNIYLISCFLSLRDFTQMRILFTNVRANTLLL